MNKLFDFLAINRHVRNILIGFLLGAIGWYVLNLFY